MKVYVDTTGELVIERTNAEYRYPAFSDISRIKVGAGNLQIETPGNKSDILESTLFSDLQDSGGTPYASFAALKLALDPYFDDIV